MNEYAFPQNDFVASNGQIQPGQSGMYLLDYFAAKAMQANISTNPGWITGSTDMEFIAEASYRMAKYMTKEREKFNENI